MNLRVRIRLRFQDWAMRQMDELRPATLAHAQGEVLEVGFGTGLNLRRIADGCNMNRRIDELVAMAGVELRTLERFRARGPAVLAAMDRGEAARE